MRPAGRITCICLFLLIFTLTVSALAIEPAGTVSPAGGDQTISPQKPAIAEEKTEMGYVDPDLESILAEKDGARYQFLSRLTPNEQRELARMIKQRVDDEAGVVVSIMAIVSGFVPAIISAQFADKMEPATVARISDKVSIKKAIAIAKHLDPSFLADVAVYQDPEKVTAVVEGLPDKDLVEITRILFTREEYRVVAKFSDGLSVEKLRNVSEKINDPATLIAIARKMKNRDNAVQTAIGLSDDYLLGFMNLLSSDDDFELAAAVGRALDVNRQINILNRLEPEKAARLAAYYSPETLSRILEAVDDKHLTDIASHLDPKTMGHVALALNPGDINRFIKLVDRPQLLAMLPYTDMSVFKGAWSDLTPENQRLIKDIGKEFPPLEEVIGAAK